MERKCKYCNQEILARYSNGKINKNKVFCSRQCMASSYRRPDNLNRTPFYRTWQNMKNRCNNPTNPQYKNYGGRGILVDPKWINFKGFYEDMFDSYEEGFSIERIDVNGNYCKENCIWIPLNEQSKNRRNVKRYEYQGKMYLLSELAKEIGINERTLIGRIHNYKMPLSKALQPGKVTRCGKKSRKPIKVFRDGVFVAKYESIGFCCKDLNLWESGVSSTLAGRQSNCQGYTFEYI